MCTPIALARVFPGLFAVENPKLRAVRPDDQLVLTFEFVNMTLHRVSESQPEAYALPGKDARLVVHFQPQNIAEKAYFETDPNVSFQSAKAGDTNNTKLSGDPLDPPPVPSRMAKASRLVFKVPADEGPIPLELEVLLKKCSEYELSVAPTALPPEARVYWLDRFAVQKRFDLMASSQVVANLGGPANVQPLLEGESRIIERRALDLDGRSGADQRGAARHHHRLIPGAAGDAGCPGAVLRRQFQPGAAARHGGRYGHQRRNRGCHPGADLPPPAGAFIHRNQHRSTLPPDPFAQPLRGLVPRHAAGALRGRRGGRAVAHPPGHPPAEQAHRG